MGAVIDYLPTLLAILDGLSMPLKLAWGVWLAWGLAHAAWRYWPRATPPVYAPPDTAAREVRPVTARRAASTKQVPHPVAPYGTSDFIAALDQEQAALATLGDRESTSAYR